MRLDISLSKVANAETDGKKSSAKSATVSDSMPQHNEKMPNVKLDDSLLMPSVDVEVRTLAVQLDSIISIAIKTRSHWSTNRHPRVAGFGDEWNLTCGRSMC